MMPNRSTLIALFALVLALLGSLFGNYVLTEKVSGLETEVARREKVEEGLNSALAAAQRNASKNAKRTEELQSTRKEIDRAPDAPIPAALERALDGLRDRQRGSRP